MLVDVLQLSLSSAPTIQALLGTVSTRRDQQTGIFPILAPEQVPMPYIVMSEIGGAPATDSYNGANALQDERWRFSCYGSTYKQAKTVAKALKQVLLDLIGNFDAQKCQVDGMFLRLEADNAQSIATHGTEYGSHVDFEILYVDYDV